MKLDDERDYWDGFIEASLDLVSEKRTIGWFSGKEEFLHYCRRGYTPPQLFVMDVAWDIEELASGQA